MLFLSNSVTDKRVIIMRHEPTLENRLGIIQGQSIDSAIEVTKIDERKINWCRENVLPSAVLISSCAMRSKQSAQLISLALGVSSLTTPLFRQRGWGNVEGKTIKELGNAFVKNAFIADTDKLASGAESLLEVCSRARSAWAFIKGLTERTIIVVTHDEFGNYLVNEMLGEGLFKRPLNYNEAHIIELKSNSLWSARLHVTVHAIPFKHRVFIREDAPTFKIAEDGLGTRILNNRGIEVVNDSKEIGDGSIEGIIVGNKPFTYDDLAKYPNLKVVSRFGKGVDGIRIKPNKNLQITNTLNCNEYAVAEFTVALVIDLARGISNAARKLSISNLWISTLSQEWSRIRIGIVGLGIIGQSVAEILKTLGFSLIVWTAHPDKHSDFLEKNGLLMAESLDKLFSNADIVTLHISANNETKNLIDSKKLALMSVRKGCIINTSRAEVLDYRALKVAFRKGWISGAALDVWPEEPIKSRWLRQLMLIAVLITAKNVRQFTTL